MPRRPLGKRAVSNGKVTVRGKVANGEGSVYFAGDGRWRATYRVGGERRPRTVSARTRELVIAARDRKVAELAAAPESPSSLPPTTSVGDLAQWWLHTVQAHQVRASTLSQTEDRVARIVDTIGSIEARNLRVEQVAGWQTSLLETLSPKTVAHHRQTLAQVMDQAVELGLAPTNVVRRVKPPKATPPTQRVLSVEECKALIRGAEGDRYRAAVAVLFMQGWRVSEVLGLAWEDIDLDKGLATVRRACTYVGHVGSSLGPTKTTGVMGEHHLTPAVVELLRERRRVQAAEQLAHDGDWPHHEYGGTQVNLVFTTPTGGLVLRQTITKSIHHAAERVGIPTAKLGTHTGRRSVITALYSDGGESIEEIARYVGHSSPTTTSAYVRDLGSRPADFAHRAALLFGDIASVGP